MTRTDQGRQDEAALEALMDELREAEFAPRAEFLASLADQVPEAARASAPRPRSAPLWEAIGGWFGAVGLTAAACAGLWLGIVPPAALEQAWGEGVDLFPEYISLADEG